MYLAYMATSLTAVFLCVTVLFASIFSGSHNVTFGRFISKLASGIIQMNFMDLSGSNQDGENREEEFLPDIFDNAPSTDSPYPNKPQNPPNDTDESGNNMPLTLETLYQFDYLSVPSGEIPIIPMDLSLSAYGNQYIYNSTGLVPDLQALLTNPLTAQEGAEYMSVTSAPKVLILHTHGTEAYSVDGAVSYREDGGELARSTDPAESVVSVGAVISDELNHLGIPSIHCTIMHDQEQYRNSYARAKETIEKYLERYPTIQLVIDVHRDSIVKSTGELVRPVTLLNGEAAAQVMCVVGSNWGGEENPNWEKNLALALKLRERLNTQCENICRPAYLRSSTYNQELSPYSLLLEMGASGNSLEEAQRSAYLIAEALADLWSEL
ncbi:MAG: stage II sporulation protein P [Clostridia bacterium]|nr:stage II sporulation protein P [Clostridia bacterium]